MPVLAILSLVEAYYAILDEVSLKMIQLANHRTGSIPREDFSGWLKQAFDRPASGSLEQPVLNLPSRGQTFGSPEPLAFSATLKARPVKLHHAAADVDREDNHAPGSAVSTR